MQNPIFLGCPVVVSDNKVRLGRPPEAILEII
ncbi:MAG TPA: hypothetical protein EYO32_02270 [Rhodospirillales bacterium]|nr:hypothetical protein [Rhodospirillales bacterium]